MGADRSRGPKRKPRCKLMRGAEWGKTGWPKCHLKSAQKWVLNATLAGTSRDLVPSNVQVLRNPAAVMLGLPVALTEDKVALVREEASATDPRVSHGGWRARRGDAEKTGYAEPCWRRSVAVN